MNKRKMFGCRNWFIKNAIYDMLIENKDYFGIDAIEYDNKIELDEKEINMRYKLCNLIKNYLIGENYITNTDIMAVLYKIKFIIVDGRLQYCISDNSEMVNEIYKQQFEQVEQAIREELI